MYKNKPRLVSKILVLLPFGAENQASKGSGMSSKGKNRWQWEEKYDECWIKKKITEIFVSFCIHIEGFLELPWRNNVSS